ncbi:MAG: polysaccharide biosynthesis C-terminal domain-containing protein [Patescibacteria group bacterium]
MRVVSFVFFFYFLSSLFTYLLIAGGEQKRLLKINAFIATANLVGNLLVIPHFSFIGSACVTLASQILLLFMTAHAAKSVSENRFFLSTTFSIVALSVVCSTIAYAVLGFSSPYGTFVSLLLSSAAFGVPYLGGGLALKKLSKKYA